MTTIPDQLPDQHGGTEKTVHLICCKPNSSLCGQDLTGAADIPANAVLTCSVCDLIDEAGSTCGARFCRVRQWLRQWFGWWR